MKQRTLRGRRAAALLVALLALMLIVMVGAQLLRSLTRSQRQSREHSHAIQALWLADGGLARATARLKGDGDYAGETWLPIVADAAGPNSQAMIGRVEITVAKDDTDQARRRIRVVAAFPDDPTWRVQQIREQVISLTVSGESP